MAIQIPTAGAIFYTQYSASTVQTICDGISGALVTCGWTSTAVPGTSLFTFTGVPSNGNTFIVGPTTYTFVTTLTATPNQVHIGATAAQCATNMFEAITAGPNSGIDYSSGTVANTQATATNPSAGLCRITTLGSGFATNSLVVVTNGLANATLTENNGGNTNGRGYKVVMPATPQGLTGAVFLDDVSATYARIRFGTADGSVQSANNSALGNNVGVCVLNTAAETREFAGCAHQFFTWLLFDSASAGRAFCCGVPYIRPYHVPTPITAATNATPIQITATAHGLITGEDAFISDVQGNTAANGFWTVTVIDANNITLNGSTGNGAYTASTGLLATNNQIARCLWMNGQSISSVDDTFRKSLAAGQNTSTDSWVCVNQYSYGASQGAPVPGPTIKTPRHPYNINANNGTILNWGMIADLFEPFICWGATSLTSQILQVGELWAAFVTTETLPMDRIKLAFVISGVPHDCVNFTDGSQEPRGSLWLLKN
jgi:hypothetical protein